MEHVYSKCVSRLLALFRTAAARSSTAKQWLRVFGEPQLSLKRRNGKKPS